MAERTENDGIRGDRATAKHLHRHSIQVFEVGLDALLEIEQAYGKVHLVRPSVEDKDRDNKWVKYSIPAFYFGCQQPHDLKSVG